MPGPRSRVSLLLLFTASSTSPQSEELQAAFAPYGNIQSVKVIRDKGGERSALGWSHGGVQIPSLSHRGRYKGTPRDRLLHPPYCTVQPAMAAAQVISWFCWSMYACTVGGAGSPIQRHCLLHAVAYVKYDRPSAAALSIESLNGAVLNNGRGPKLKVLLAEAPTTRCVGATGAVGCAFSRTDRASLTGRSPCDPVPMARVLGCLG